MRFSWSSRSGSRPPAGSSSRRRFFFAAKIALALPSKPGAAMHSTKSLATSSAVAASTTRLNASTPPNAETGSHASAFRYASRKVACSAVPQGLLCLMMTAAGLLEFRGQAARRFEIDKIVVGKFLALELLGGRQALRCAVPRERTARRPGADFRRSAIPAGGAERCARAREAAGFASSAIWPDAAESRSNSVVIMPS